MLNATRKVHRSPVAGSPGVIGQGHSKSQLQFSKYVPSTCQVMAQLPNYSLRNPYSSFEPQEAFKLPDRTIHSRRRGVRDGHHEQTVQGRDHERGDRVRIKPLVDKALFLSVPDQDFARAVPGLDSLLEDGWHRLGGGLSPLLLSW